MAGSGIGFGSFPVAAMMDGLMRTATIQGELGVAAARTIGYRTAMMAGAFQDPRALTDPEFVRMGAEKVEAAAESATALVAGFADMQEAWMSLLTGPVQAAALAFGGIGTCRTPMDLIDIQRRCVQDSVTAGMAAGMRFAESAAALGGAALGPLHRKASANARRLERRQHRLWGTLPGLT
ncbi:phasin family protein [Azospirillum halopraeferens]|uniref:phasin family protein n=1 Tax=Azospirillum halopraeferens TaxID=34010 RepID=UPI0004164CCC|nr:phasin family protein [Azospirillum halopraeferens]